MSTNPTTEHRTHYQPPPGRAAVREVDDGADGLFRVRMPIASTGEVRNEDDDPLTRDEIEGMAEQLDSRTVGVFIDHGRNDDVAGSRYSAIEKAGTWDAGDLEQRDGVTELVADAVLMDPKSLPDETGSLREALSRMKSQIERDIPLAASIGWQADDDAPGGVDLVEASIVGIPADPRAVGQESGAEVAARAVEAAKRTDSSTRSLPFGFRAPIEEDEPTDAERAAEALELLEHLAEFHNVDEYPKRDRRRGWSDRAAPLSAPDPTPPERIQVLEDVLEAFGSKRTPPALENRLDELTGSYTHQRAERKEVLRDLRTIRDNADEYAKPTCWIVGSRGSVEYPVGMSHAEGEERITEAVDELRDLLPGSVDDSPDPTFSFAGGGD